MPTLTNVLYVEDDIDIQAVAKIALETVGGFTLRSCRSGQEALDLFQNELFQNKHQASADTSVNTFIPDLILLDVMMPEMDGPATLKNLRKIPFLKEVPVIFMTAKVQVNEIACYHSLGAISVIAKPFDPMQLAEQLRRIWDENRHKVVDNVS